MMFGATPVGHIHSFKPLSNRIGVIKPWIAYMVKPLYNRAVSSDCGCGDGISVAIVLLDE